MGSLEMQKIYRETLEYLKKRAPKKKTDLEGLNIEDFDTSNWVK